MCPFRSIGEKSVTLILRLFASNVTDYVRIFFSLLCCWCESQIVFGLKTPFCLNNFFFVSPRSVINWRSKQTHMNWTFLFRYLWVNLKWNGLPLHRTNWNCIKHWGWLRVLNSANDVIFVTDVNCMQCDANRINWKNLSIQQLIPNETNKW